MGTDEMPWDALADAFGRLQDAERAVAAGGDVIDRALAEADLDAARADLLRAQEHMGALGGLLLLMALDHGGQIPRNRLARLVSDLTDPSHEAALKAARLAKRVWNEIDALKERVRELEEQLARLTPGVGEPGLRLVR